MSVYCKRYPTIFTQFCFPFRSWSIFARLAAASNLLSQLWSLTQYFKIWLKILMHIGCFPTSAIIAKVEDFLCKPSICLRKPKTTLKGFIPHSDRVTRSVKNPRDVIYEKVIYKSKLKSKLPSERNNLTYTYIYIYIHTYTYTYIHIHIHTYIYIYIHTYTYRYKISIHHSMYFL